ncbi:PLAC8 family protein [Sarocladium strictum]|jgi:Cys-rich protein (TIGR01571 family)
MANQQTTQGGPINDQDVNDWKNRFNDVLARPSEHLNSRSNEGAQSWFSSFFSCFSPVDTCLITCCVPCVTFGKTHHRLRKNGNLDGYEPINTSCLLFCGSSCFGVHWIPTAMQRENIREKYNLEGSCVKDLLASFCCPCCTLMQSDKEAAHREGLLQHAPQTQQYETNNTGMVYPQTGEVAPAPVAAPMGAPAQAPITEK